MSRVFDLKLRLALRVVALAALCFTAASAYLLYESDQAARAKAEGIAKLVASDLELQQDQVNWLKVANDPRPDLNAIALPLYAPGVCVAYRSPAGAIQQRVCNGREPGETDAPRLFSAIYAAIFKPGAEITQPILVHNQVKGEAIVGLDPQSLIAQSWQQTSGLLIVMGVTLAALCLLVYAALARALRPTRAIKAGLERLAANDLSARLPDFDLAELSAIGAVFNSLAEQLQTTLAERNELTRRLIAVQDDERRHLARELHDEFGQCLAAIGAVAAAAGQTAEKDCPALLPDCQSIARTSAHMMDMLRGTLIRLRPPDVDELGLAANLESLVAGWNNRCRGRTRFELEVLGNVDALPSSFGASLYRIAQEAITNAAKHAEATRVGLKLEMRESEEIALSVEDNGKSTEADMAQKSGLGLTGMRERIAALGGRLAFETRAPSGLILHAVIATPNGAHTQA
ncbi:MAG: histidine kinase [Methylovirgula sp.]|jgi:signal transduction histidine kinase